MGKQNLRVIEVINFVAKVIIDYFSFNLGNDFEEVALQNDFLDL